MTPDERRLEARDELRELLQTGSSVDDAVHEIASAYGFRENVVRHFGAKLIEEQPNLVAARQRSDARAGRQRRADMIVKRYRDVLNDNPKAESKFIEDEVGILDFSDDERSDLFLRTIDCWLDRNIEGGNAQD